MNNDNDKIKCCDNCKHCIPIPRNNKYGDIDHLCTVNEYFVSGIKKDITKIERYTPGGRKLDCYWKIKDK